MAEFYRNFRSNYYDKVGFRGVEERKSLEILLGEKPLNIAKLSQFCLRFTIPTKYREYVWSLILGILPVNPENHQVIRNEHQEWFSELQNSLQVMHKTDDTTPMPELLTYAVLLEDGQLQFDIEKQFVEKDTQDLLTIATTMTRMCRDPCSAYLLTRQFWGIQKKFLASKPHVMVEKFVDLLKQEDPELHNHLLSVSALTALPVIKWFRHFFADILPENPLERVWDKIAAGNCKILVCVGSALLTTLRRSLLSLRSPEEVANVLNTLKIPEDNADRIVNNALEYWHQNYSGLQL